MGFHTEYTGRVAIEPPLNRDEIEYLRRFSGTRRMKRKSGPYSTPEPRPPWLPDEDVLHNSQPPEGQPGLTCQWDVDDSGTWLAWNHRSRFYFGAEWIQYLISTFWAADCAVQRELRDPVPDRYYAPEFEAFTFDHVLNGEIHAVAEENDESWRIVVRDNSVQVTP